MTTTGAANAESPLSLTRMNNTHYDSLCSACLDVFADGALERLHSESKKEWKFHSTPAIMAESARDGCRLCTLILANPNVRTRPPETQLKCALSLIKPDSPSTTDGRTFALLISYLSVIIESWFTVCIKAVDPHMSRNFNGRRIAPEGSFAESTLHQIQNWMSVCLHQHDTCRDSWMLVAEKRKLPTRLMDVSNPDTVRIVDTVAFPVDIAYFTLSHRWSSIPVISLTNKTYDTFCKGIPLLWMPKTFKEAIELTRLLGVHYLWIDSLCIIQDSREDWLRESSMMGEVYAHGTLNIAATASNDGDGGLYGRELAQDRLLPRLISSHQWGGSRHQDYVIYLDYDPAFPEIWKKSVEDTPLGQRGWVLQERILSPRVAHFAANQCFWECCQATAAELFPKEIFKDDGFLKQVVTAVPPKDPVFQESQNLLYTHWDALIEKYSRCDLTFDSDKLVAFSGLAQRACRQLNLDPSNYLAGLLKPKIAQGLLWRVAQYDPRRRAVAGRAPSWSWTSRKGTVYTFSEEVQLWETEQCHITILDTEMFHDGDPFGQVTGGRLLIRGLLFRDVATFSKRPFNRWIKDDEMEYLNSYFLLVLTHQSASDIHTTVVSGIMIVPTEAKRGQFRRVGVLLNREIQNIQVLLEHGRKIEGLDQSLYLEADSETGFTIELV